MTRRPVVILGGGGHATVVADACRTVGLDVFGCLAREHRAGASLPVLGDDEMLKDAAFVRAHDFVPGVGSFAVRRRLVQAVRQCGGTLLAVRHATSVIADGVAIGDGTVLFAGTVINPGVSIGEFAVVNTGATVDHDCILEDGAEVGPGAHLAGSVICREGAFVGIGACVIQGVEIGARAIVGAGSVVLTDVAADTTVAGNPARLLRGDK